MLGQERLFRLSCLTPAGTHAILEFEASRLIEMKEGDHLAIPSHIKHRVSQTGPETIWLAVHVKTQLQARK